MLSKIFVTILCLVLSSFGCGSSTPEPESADSPSDDNAEVDDTAGEAEELGDSSNDPETTEEVIETSEPLD